MYIFAVTSQDEGEWLIQRSAFFTTSKALLVILQEAEWTPGLVWTRRSEEKFPALRHPGMNPGRPSTLPLELLDPPIIIATHFKFNLHDISRPPVWYSD